MSNELKGKWQIMQITMNKEELKKIIKEAVKEAVEEDKDGEFS